MFEINPKIEVKKEELLGTTIFVIEDFYEKPDEVFNLLFNREIPLWKIDETPTVNGVHFEDRRTIEYNYSLKKVYEYLKTLCNQNYFSPEIVTNVTKFYEHDYNDWKNYIWWPHRDTGYNGIVYFSDECGTNLYSPDYEAGLEHEHKDPWIKKGEYRVLKTLEPKYNNLVFFDGLKFPHGMDVSSDRYFNEYRYNQVFFFDHPDYSDAAKEVLNAHRDKLLNDNWDVGDYVDVEDRFYNQTEQDQIDIADIEDEFYEEFNDVLLKRYEDNE